VGREKERYTYKAACKASGCKNDFFPDKWGAMEAQRLGWFLQKNGDSWCPEHIPDWVAEWRARRVKKEKP
jgi:hypothetical protein